MKYLVNRLLWCIPTLFAVVLIGFVLLVNTPGDPVTTILHLSSEDDPMRSSNPAVERQKKEWEDKLGLNLPLFYVSIQSNILPDTLHKITNSNERKIIKFLSFKTKNPNAVLQYRTSIKIVSESFSNDIEFISDSLKDVISPLIEDITYLMIRLNSETNTDSIFTITNKINHKISREIFPSTWSSLGVLIKSVEDLSKKQSKNLFTPSIQFHKKSRFHQWLFGDGTFSKGIIRGDFGISYTTGEPVNKHIYKSLFWSVLFSGVGILLAYIISIPIGIRSAIHNNTTGEKIMTVLLFALYSIPVFFLGTLLQTYLANDQYLHIFEPTGIKPTRGFTPDSNVLEKIWQTLPYMILPVICYTYSSIAFLTRLTKTSILETFNQPYITTARAKGLPFKKVVYKHAFKNALIPLVTVFANVFPVLVGGSVIIESIFTIPGMGTEMFNSYFTHNIPVIISIFTLTGIFTVIGFFVSDILYVIVDPRIRK